MEDVQVESRDVGAERSRPGLLGEAPVDAVLRAIAEFIGSFIFFFVGIGALVSVSITAEEGLLVTALAHGLALAVVVSALAHISGGHFNPAVTIGFLVTRRIAPALAAMYLVAQLAAGAAAALMIRWLWPGSSAEATGFGSPAVDPGLKTGEALVLEALITFFLVWVFFAVAADLRGPARAASAFAVGLIYGVGILVAGPLTGGMANPARAFGPQLVDGSWDDFWLWYAGPILGGAIAALLYELLYLRPARAAVADDDVEVEYETIEVVEADVDLDEPRPGGTAL